MHTSTDADIRHALESALDGRRLLDHPFYRRWECGALAPAELADYADQYRHVERALPSVLSTTADQLPDGRARDFVEANLAEERAVPVAHAELFESFATAAGATPARSACGPTPATERLIELQRSTAEGSPSAALAVLAAYEVQAADIAATKAASLRRHFGFDAAGTAFWDVHAELEASHADWSVEALVELGAPPEDVERSARAAAECWWAFLDEREALVDA